MSILTKGFGKREALLAAQQHLRSTENGKYDNPRYWAAFIMLDAAD